MPFADALGAQWTVAFNTAVARRMRSDIDFDPLGEEGDRSGPSRFMERCASDQVFLVSALYCACRSADGTPPSDPDRFAEGLVGDALGRACDELLDAFASFSPRPQVRTAYRRALKVLRNRTDRELDSRLKAMSESELDRLISSALGSGTTSTSSPASSGSTLARSPTASSRSWREGDRRSRGTTRAASSRRS